MSLQERIQEKYPEGLTGIFALGGTRTSYITQCRRDEDEPGAIEDFEHYGEYSLSRSLDIMKQFFNLGGTHAIWEVLDIQRFSGERKDYIDPAIQAIYRLIDDQRREFYLANHIDPYFAGIDTLMYLAKDHPAQQLAQVLRHFSVFWKRQPTHRKLIMSIAAIPVYTFSHLLHGATYDEQNLLDLAQQLYKQYATAAYGVYVPPPVFYLGQARNGSMQSASRLPLALDITGKLRLYYTPYPSLYLTCEGLETILEDVLRSGDNPQHRQYDYRGQMTSAMANQLHEEYCKLASQPDSILGLSRR